MKKNYALFSILFCMVAMTAAAQPSYRIYNDAKVKITAADALFPWAGGMNKPQFSDIDLDDDGSKDLVVFDRTGNTISTFLNKGTAGQVLYEYAPVYESVFPEMTHWMLLVDYNCDGAEDIFTSHDTGIKTFLADRSSGDLQFIPDVQKIQYEEVGFSFDLGVLVIDIPTIIYVNGDGDMDVLTFNLAGGFV